MENGQRKKKYPISGRSLDDNTGVNYEQEAEATVYTDSAKVGRNWAKICYEIRVVHSSKRHESMASSCFVSTVQPGDGIMFQQIFSCHTFGQVCMV